LIIGGYRGIYPLYAAFFLEQFWPAPECLTSALNLKSALSKVWILSNKATIFKGEKYLRYLGSVVGTLNYR
jgi:hypothetical protein